MQSTCYDKLHVAIIMDGNGRWANRRRLPRVAGHKAGIGPDEHYAIERFAVSRFGEGGCDEACG